MCSKSWVMSSCQAEWVIVETHTGSAQLGELPCKVRMVKVCPWESIVVLPSTALGAMEVGFRSRDGVDVPDVGGWDISCCCIDHQRLAW